VAISGALTLLANIVMAWMTQHIQRVLDAWQRAGTRHVEGDRLRHIAPVHMQGINLRGVLQFPVARYRNRLILETPARARQRVNATTGDAHQSPEAIDSARESDSTEC
jgi:Tn3 transposase DDE domain